MKLTTSQRSALTRLEFEYGGQCRAMDIGLVGEDLNELAWGKMIENIGSNVFGHPIWRITEAGRNAMKEGR